ncbi:MAG: T9SS type A sorting domain-containing protein [Bacteroidota bacterium]
MRIYITIFLFLFSYECSLAQIFLTDKGSSPSDFFQFNSNIERNIPPNFYKTKGYKPIERLRHRLSMRTDSAGHLPATISVFDEYKKLLRNKTQQFNQNTNFWQELGPRLPQKGSDKRLSGSGRANVVAFDPLDSNLIWLGSASGGLWKSTNRGRSWEVVPFTEFLSMGVSDIAIPAQNPNTIYVATGDADGSSFFGCFSLGIIKSTDKGNTWEILPTGIEYSSGQFISKLLVHPENPQILYAATSTSIIKSTDAGKSWQTLTDGFNFRDLCFKEGTPDVLFATTYSLADGAFLLISEDAGENWFFANYWRDASRVKLATTPIDPSRLLALCVSKHTNSFGGLYLSDSDGYFWQALFPDTAKYSELVQAQGFFNLVLSFLPNSKDEFYVGGVWLYRGSLRSDEFTPISNEVHVDMHDIKYNRFDGKIYLANDGGIYRFNPDFSKIENISSNLGITQFYRIGLSPYNPRLFYGGSQDNNVYEYFYDKWKFFWAGDGMECFVAPDNPSLVYFSTQRGNLFNTETGKMEIPSNEKRPWVASFGYHFANPKIVYCGYENLWTTTDKGLTWQKISDFADSSTINAIASSYSDENVFAVAKSNNLYYTANSGKNWTALLQLKSPISAIQFDIYSNLWIACGGFATSLKLFRWNNSNLENHSYNLPNIPVNCIVIDSTTDIIYVGTDIGVFRKRLRDTVWLPAGDGLPAVIINELEIHYGTGTLFAATFGRGVWALQLWECPAEKPIVAVPERVVFCPDEEVTLEVLNPVSDYTYIWNNGSRGSSLKVSQSGNYYVSAVRNNGCLAVSDTVYLWKPASPEINLILLTSNPICEGDTAMILAKIQSSQKVLHSGWSNGRIGLIGQFTQAGKYFFWLTDEYNCRYTSSLFEIFVNPLPPKPTIRKNGNWLETDATGTLYWYANDTLIADASDNRCYAFAPGRYYVIVQDANYCKNSSDTLEIRFESSPVANMQVRLAPNPTNELLTLELNLLEESQFEITIYNTLGQEVFLHRYPSRRGYVFEQIDLRQFAPSAYFVSIRNEFGSLSKSFVVLR